MGSKVHQGGVKTLSFLERQNEMAFMKEHRK